MEETLALQSERDFHKAIEDNSQFLLTTFTQRHRRFDGERLTQRLVRLLIMFNGNITWLQNWLKQIIRPLEAPEVTFTGKGEPKLHLLCLHLSLSRLPS